MPPLTNVQKCVLPPFPWHDARMEHTGTLFSLFMIFTGAAVIATLALYARQALLVSYIVLGVLFGPAALNIVSDASLISDIAGIGIVFLLFLLGLNLEPRDLKKLFREALVVTTVSSLAFLAVGLLVARAAGLAWLDSLLVGATMMFSSTIIALKLLPTSALHHQRMGEMIVSILLLQDMLAIALLLLLQTLAHPGDSSPLQAVLPLVGLPLVALAAWWFASKVIVRLIGIYDQIPEYLFLLAIGWCMGLAELTTLIGLSHEIGAFIAGVTLATSPIARFIAESLKPLRDFFLILFFFALGAGFDVGGAGAVLLPAALLAVLSVWGKPMVFRWLLRFEQEKARMANETGARLGQISEFSLLLVVVATEVSLMSERASLLIQSATLLSFVISSYWIVRRYPTPISMDSALRRD